MQKITVIMATGTSPVQCFFRSIISLLLHTDREVLDQIIVSINGPDDRTGEPIYQDRKQQLCEDLADMGYPVTVARVWSRVGFGQPYDMVTPLIRTDECLYMQDDVIVRKDWLASAIPLFFDKPDVTSMSDRPKVMNRLLANLWDWSRGTLRIDFPYLNNSFMLCRMSKVKERWQGHYMNLPGTDLNTVVDLPAFRAFWQTEGNYTVLPGPDAIETISKMTRMSVNPDWKTYELATTGFGSWVYYDWFTSNAASAAFSLGTIEHYEGMSWMGEAMNEVDLPTPILHEFRDKVRANEAFEQLFQKHMPETAPMPDLSAVKPLVGVIVYSRMDCIDAWLKAWNNSEHYGAKIAVFHTYDGESPPEDQKNNILKHNPDFYVPVPNLLGDLGVFAQLCENKLSVDFDWNALCWFTDDVIPLRKDFLYPMLFELGKPNVGMMGGWHNENNVRTVHFGIQRETMNKLSFEKDYQFIQAHKAGMALNDGVPLAEYTDERLFGNMRNHFVSTIESELAGRVRDLGYMVVPSTFRYSAKYAWDCDHEGIVNLWHKYEAQFNG